MFTPAGLARVLTLACLFAAAHSADAQLTPERTYYGVARPVPVRVAVPADSTGNASIRLFAPERAEPSAKANVEAGLADLASLFPVLWTDKDQAVRYAQLVVGDKKVGPPLVLQPLLNPPLALTGADGLSAAMVPDPSGRPAIRYSSFPPKLSGLRVYVDKHVLVTTSMGDIEFRLRPDQAPNTAWNFRQLADGGFYTDIVFHRIVGPDFMLQVGDPTGTGEGGPGYYIDLEPSSLPHDFGVLSMARTGHPNTGGSQVFVCLSRRGTSFLDGQYTSFGQAVSGAEVIQKLGAVQVKPGPNGEMSQPVNPPKIISAKLVDAPPLGEGPKTVTRPGELAPAPTQPVPAGTQDGATPPPAQPSKQPDKKPDGGGK